MFLPLLGLIFFLGLPALLRAQSNAEPAWRRSVSTETPPSASAYWRKFALGFGASIVAHESAHIVSSLVMGFHPHVGLDRGRPTIFSGIDSRKYPHRQFIFSASGLTTQTIINEAILDIPHAGGGAVERGILAGGIATTLFYITLGRNGAVSDVAFMARTSSLSKTQLSLIFGGASAIQAFRISKDPRYDHFFVGPTNDGFGVGFSFRKR
jgi:hypothetical protein